MPAKVSVIIPVYGAEKTIEKCAESLFSQTLDDIEYIFVNDCTPDNSIEILQSVARRYPTRRGQIKIIDMPVNSRQAAARNAGLAHATGEYIIHCDPDDWIDTKLYEDMYSLAKDKRLDISSCDYIIEDESNKAKECLLPSVDSPYDILCCERYYIMSLWAHLVRREIITANSLHFFPNINCSEDVGLMARVFAVSKNIGHISSKNYYHYKKSEQSITSKLNSPEIVSQRIRCLKLIDDFMVVRGLDLTKLSMIFRFKRDIKNLFLKKESLNDWVKLFPEVCNWECRQPGSSIIYRAAYYLSHKIGTWPMRLLLMKYS